LTCLLDEIARERLPRPDARRNQRAVKRKMSKWPLKKLPPENTSHERVVIVKKSATQP
jgi:hypothetical protein